MTQIIFIRRFQIDPELGERVGALIQNLAVPWHRWKGTAPCPNSG